MGNRGKRGIASVYLFVRSILTPKDILLGKNIRAI